MGPMDPGGSYLNIMKIVVIHIWAQWTLAVVIARFFCGRQKVKSMKHAHVWGVSLAYIARFFCGRQKVKSMKHAHVWGVSLAYINLTLYKQWVGMFLEVRPFTLSNATDDTMTQACGLPTIERQIRMRLLRETITAALLRPFKKVIRHNIIGRTK
ncbi:hypothetical protein QE152_g35818 [Popillia japonica]|uniref:Uncharacterized protein n=1 Tax=Popillia japonica TaxID=7064 RepID=A0AAW1IEV3_POPJA